jgi:hypothetical protein
MVLLEGTVSANEADVVEKQISPLRYEMTSKSDGLSSSA